MRTCSDWLKVFVFLSWTLTQPCIWLYFNCNFILDPDKAWWIPVKACIFLFLFCMKSQLEVWMLVLLLRHAHWSCRQRVHAVSGFMCQKGVWDAVGWFSSLPVSASLLKSPAASSPASPRNSLSCLITVSNKHMCTRAAECDGKLNTSDP